MARYGFFIGINPYQDPQIGALKCAENDARDLAAEFKHRLGFNTTYIEERDAPGILDRLQNLEKKLQPGDTFLFYFSGHGIQHAGEQYFLLPKAKLAHLDAGVTTDTLPWKALNLCTANEHWRDVHRIFMFDACRATMGATKSGGALPSFQGEAILRKPALASSKAKTANGQQYPLTVINSCSNDQCAVELIDAETGTGKGSFTEALLGEMDVAIKAGLPFEISSQSLGRIGQRIRQRTEAFGLGDHEQSPMLEGQHPVALCAPQTKQEAIVAPAPQTAGQSLDERKWQILQDDLDEARDPEEKIRLLRAHIDDLSLPSCCHVEEARQQIKALRETLVAEKEALAAAKEAERKAREEAARKAADEQAAKEKVEREKQEREAKQKADEAAWQSTLSAVALTGDLPAQVQAYQAYAKQWQIHRKEALAQTEKLERLIKQAKAEEKQQAATARKAAKEKAEREQQTRESADEAAWKSALSTAKSTIVLTAQLRAYQAYADQWQIHRVEALARIGELERQMEQAKADATAKTNEQAWRNQQEAQLYLQAKDEKGYRNYLKEYPQGKYATEASAKLAELEAEAALWQTACQQNTRAAYEHYWRVSQLRQHAEEARTRIASLPEPNYKPLVVSVLAVAIALGFLGYLRNKETTVSEIASEPAEASAPPAATASVYPTAGSGQTFRDAFQDGGGQGPEMVVIPVGSFQIGSNEYAEEKPIHPVTISKVFALGKYEVTQGQWRAVMGSNPSLYKTCGDTCPVEGVSWNDIQAFIQKLNAQTGQSYRLPSEAEWEYACRAGKQSDRYCGGNDEGSVAWYDKNMGNKTHPVGQKAANAWGLYDMSGNVYEWIQDCWIDNYNNSPKDERARQTGTCDDRVLRGGFLYFKQKELRAAYRNYHSPDNRDYNSGFRLARTLP